jgi:hypothetical protein
VARLRKAVLETARPLLRMVPGFDSSAGAEMNVLGVLRIARDSAKVEDQVRLLARTLNGVALEPDGKAAASGTVRSMVGSFEWVRLPCPPLRQLETAGGN